MAGYKRRRFFVDRRVQGALVLRSLFYWVFCLLTITVMMICWRMVTMPVLESGPQVQSLWTEYAPVAIASFFMLPIIVMDTIRLSNRFAGPMLRFRRKLRELADGESIEPLKFRDHDYWSEMADDFNKVAAKLGALKPYQNVENESAARVTADV
jgi:hypothetical protein